MSDPTSRPDTDPSAVETEQSQPRPAQPGVKDADQDVHTFGGERIDGSVADVADGD